MGHNEAVKWKRKMEKKKSKERSIVEEEEGYIKGVSGRGRALRCGGVAQKEALMGLDVKGGKGGGSQAL